VADGRVALAPLVTDRVAFPDVGGFLEQALRGAVAGPRIKAVIDHAPPPSVHAPGAGPASDSPP
jgi:hypothetical protein